LGKLKRGKGKDGRGEPRYSRTLGHRRVTWVRTQFKQGLYFDLLLLFQSGLLTFLQPIAKTLEHAHVFELSQISKYLVHKAAREKRKSEAVLRFHIG
jgi:hypothetical protein